MCNCIIKHCKCSLHWKFYSLIPALISIAIETKMNSRMEGGGWRRGRIHQCIRNSLSSEQSITLRAIEWLSLGLWGSMGQEVIRVFFLWKCKAMKQSAFGNSAFKQDNTYKWGSTVISIYRGVKYLWFWWNIYFIDRLRTGRYLTEVLTKNIHDEDTLKICQKWTQRQ